MTDAFSTVRDLALADAAVDHVALQARVASVTQDVDAYRELVYALMDEVARLTKLTTRQRETISRLLELDRERD